MSNQYLTGLFHAGRLALGTDLAIHMSPIRLGSAAVLDYYAQSQHTNNGGSDFFDFLPVEPHGLIALMGHVCGENAASTAVMLAAVRRFLRTALPMERDHMGRVVRDLNRTICDTSPDSFYVSLFCATLDAERRQLHYVNAGHEPALLLRHDGGRVCRLDSTGTILGLTTRSAYGQRTISLEPGDLLAAFSEGLADAGGPTGATFGAQGVMHQLREHAGANAGALVSFVMAAAREFADRVSATEDRTLQVVRFNGPAAGSRLEEKAEAHLVAA